MNIESSRKDYSIFKVNYSNLIELNSLRFEDKQMDDRHRAIQRNNPTYKIESVSRVYANVNEERGKEWYCFSDNWIIPAKDPRPYEIELFIGSGKYSDVFIGWKGETKVALKVLKPVREEKYLREAKILLNLKGGTNIIELLDIVQNPITKQYSFVFEYVENLEFNKLFRQFTDMDCRYYLYQLMQSLQYCHSRGIMHRDVKPSNIMYDYRQKKLRLIDWGLADFYFPHRRYSIHVASRNFKAIELLVDYQCYDYSVDIWSFGVTMASIIFEKHPFFPGQSDFDMVAKICSCLGKKDFNAYLDKYAIVIPPQMKDMLPKGPRERKDLWKKAQKRELRLASSEAVDLINCCLRYDHTERITASEALHHPYFDPVRNL